MRTWVELGDNTYISLAEYIQSLKTNNIILGSYVCIILHAWSFARTPRITELGASLAGATVKVIFTDNVSLDMEICTNTGGSTQHLWRYHENGNDYKVLKQIY